MVFRILLSLAALLLPAQAFANDLEGNWAFRIDDATVFVFILDELEDGRWQGQWMRPENITSNGVVFRQMSGAQLVRAVQAAQRGGMLQLIFTGPQGDGRGDTLRFRLVSDNQAEVTYVGVPTDPYPLVRVLPGQELGPFDAARIYDRDNAVTEASFDPPAQEPAEEDGFAVDGLAVDGPDDAPSLEDLAGLNAEPSTPDAPSDAPADTIVDGLTDAATEEDLAPASLLGSDFLDDLSSETSAPPAPMSEPEPEPEPEPELARACSDVDAGNPPARAALEDLWGTDFEAIGTGLDIREYSMDNGDIARVTMLGERVYINSCDSAG